MNPNHPLYAKVYDFAPTLDGSPMDDEMLPYAVKQVREILLPWDHRPYALVKCTDGTLSNSFELLSQGCENEQGLQVSRG